MEVGESLRLHRGRCGTCYSDESNAYNKVATATMHHVTVCHSDYEWTRDDDGDGINEVHLNTVEGLWAEFRNFIRRFKGVSKHYLHLYVAMFGWMYNLKNNSNNGTQHKKNMSVKTGRERVVLTK